MAKVHLTEDERERMEKQDDDELRDLVVKNERKRRQVISDKKAYARACGDLIDILEAQTDVALEVLDDRDLAAGRTVPAKPVLVPPASSAKGRKKASA